MPLNFAEVSPFHVQGAVFVHNGVYNATVHETSIWASRCVIHSGIMHSEKCTPHCFSRGDHLRHKVVIAKIKDSFLFDFIFRQNRWSVEKTWVTYTVKLARAKLPANAGNFTCSSQVKRSLAQFTCVTCSLPVNTGKLTRFEAASTSRRTHANCLRAHVNLLEYYRHFTGSFTCGTHANLPATSMENCLLLQAKIHATYRQKHWDRM